MITPPSTISSVTQLSAFATEDPGDRFTSRLPSGQSLSGKSLGDMEDPELQNTVNVLERKVHHLKVENGVFSRFLEKNDPGALKEMDSLIVVSSKPRTDRMSMPSKTMTLMTRQQIKRSSLVLTHAHSSQHRSVKVNITQKSDLVMRDLEETQTHIENMKKKSHRIKCQLVARVEEIETRKEELEKSIESFQQFKISHDPLTLEKFERFMEEWSKKSRLMADKIRLRYSSLKVQYQKLSTTLAYKQLIGENLTNIDFEQLKIRNLHLTEKIEQMQLLLMELKKMTGDGNLKLSQHKSILQHKVFEKAAIEETIRQIERDLSKSDDELMKIYSELAEVREEHQKTEEKYKKYEPPDIIDYVKKKVEVCNLKKELKMWQSRRSIREIALDIEIKKLEKLIRQKRPHDSWFE